VLDPTPDLRTWPHPHERIGIALRWFGLIALARVLMGAIGSLPFFVLVPWFKARLPWFDRSLPGVLALSVLLSIPAALAPLVVWRSSAL